MKFVDCAYHPAEQNLQLIQQEQFLYYEAISLITEGEELKVWYGEGYRMFMGIPLGIKSGSDCEWNIRRRKTKSRAIIAN